jgi:hypothetical protein
MFSWWREYITTGPRAAWNWTRGPHALGSRLDEWMVRWWLPVPWCYPLDRHGARPRGKKLGTGLPVTWYNVATHSDDDV